MKKIQKQYERKIKVNQHNDAFTTFQRPSRQQPSPHLHKASRQSQNIHSQHENIESLKSTLKSLVPVSMELTRQFSRAAVHQISEDRLESSNGEQYMVKLDQLTRNLQEIASKCHFSSSQSNLSKQKTTIQSTRPAKSKTLHEKPQLSRYEATIAAHMGQNVNNTSMQLSIGRNHSFLEKDWKVQKSRSKSTRKQESSLKQIRNHQDQVWKNTQQSTSKRKRSSTKKDIVEEMLQKPSHSKNLAKIFEGYDTQQFIKGRDRSESCGKKYTTIFKEKIHRHRITSILVTDQLYTASLDYNIKKGMEKDGGLKFQTVRSFRGGVEHIASIGGAIFGCGRDSYLRSLDEDYFYKFQSTPLCLSEADRSNQINLTLLSNQLLLFDIQKRAPLCCLQLDSPFTTLAKQTKELYIGTNNALFSVDWRKKDYLVNVYKDIKREVDHWMSDPLGRTVWAEGKGQITVLGHDFRRVRTKALPIDTSFEGYHWGRNGLHILASNESKQTLLKYEENKQIPDQIDSMSDTIQTSKFLLRDKQIYYGCKDGTFLIRQTRK